MYALMGGLIYISVLGFVMKSIDEETKNPYRVGLWFYLPSNHAGYLPIKVIKATRYQVIYNSVKVNGNWIRVPYKRIYKHSGSATVVGTEAEAKKLIEARYKT